MREVLFLAHRIPFPPDRGDKIRSFHLLQNLCRVARVHVATFADDAADAAHEAGLRAALGKGLASVSTIVRTRSKGASVLASFASGRSASMEAFASATMRAAVGEVLRRDSIASIFAFSGQMSQYVPDLLGQIRFAMDFVDVDSAKFESYAGQGHAPLRWLYRREATRLAAEEAGIAARAHVSLFVTEAEAELFRGRSSLSGANVRALENGVDLAFFDPAGVEPEPAAGAPLLVFSGQMDYAPNVQAVTHFAQAILPRIRESRPGARFAIVGRNPAPAVQALGALPGVAVVGGVPDMRPWLAAAHVVVAPLQVARGVQNKVLEAMAMARPVVASPQAFEGIDAEPGRDLLVANGAEATAEAVLRVAADSGVAARIGAAARARMCERYSWDRQMAPLEELVFG
ncbi:MAG TPA: TIGR03087 family PEP-CTERM/XrtA system glycosyltransferase [Sphingomonadaceae bacterium]|nr:TIGR03087 family PEP-CTERM/XrtA system glycosyltransferase [Sphingomonadaceae bacterium]